MSSDPTKPAKPPSMLGLVIVLAVAFFLTAVLILPAIQSPREIGTRSSCVNHLKNIGIALHNYHDKYRTFPPAYVADADGKPMHSWRVLILPFFEDAELTKLYEQYDLKEPWNGPHNSKLADKMPSIFRCPNADDSANDSNYLAVVGPATAWPGDHGLTSRDISDGLSNTIMAVESVNSGINWLEPRDIPFDQAVKGINQPKAKPGISSNHEGGAHFLFADGSVHFLDIKIAPQIFHDLLTANGGENATIPE